jgi:hypothetical protein
VVLLSFALTSFTSYLFIYYLLRKALPAFVGGLIFGFCPGAVMQAVGGHLTFAFNMFVPLFLLALFHNRERRTLVSAFFVGLSYALLTLNSLYFGYFSIFIAFLFSVFDYVANRKCSLKRLLLNYLFVALFASVLIIPFQYKTIVHIMSTSHIELAKMGHIRYYGELITFSARPLDYFLPSIDHPVLGRFIGDIARSHLHGSNLFEQTLYLGFTPLLLCLAGCFLWSNRQYHIGLRHYSPFFSAGALLMIFFSMPPFIYWGDVKVPTISHLMYGIAPMFRVYARFGILANLFVACAAAVVLAELSQRVSKMRYYMLLSVLLPVLVFEYWSIPPHYARSIDPPPAVYQWLAKEPGDFIVAEYPMMKSDEAAFYTYLFWQRIHKKRMVNGATRDNTEAWEFFEKVRDLTNPDTVQLLKSVGVKYVIVHQKMYEEGQIPEPLKRYYPPQTSAATYNRGETFTGNVLREPYKSFGQDLVFAL